MPENEVVHLGYAHIKIDGAALDPDVMSKVTEIRVENDLNQPDMAIFRVEDHDLSARLDTHFNLGKAVVIEMGTKEADIKSVFDGEIISMEHDMAANHVATFVVRCFSRLHRLMRGRKTRTFQQVTDSDIFSRIVREYGLTADVESTPEKYEHVYQHNQTDYEFLMARARRIGYRVFVSDARKVSFKKFSSGGQEHLMLEWGTTLRSFRPKVTAAGQVDKVTVKSWDPKSKQAIVGNATSPQGILPIGYGKSGGQMAQQAFGTATMVITDHVSQSQSAANLHAQSILDDLSSTFVEADGLCDFDHKLKPNGVVEIKNIGTNLNGKYRVTSTTHHYSHSEGLSSQFGISGKRADTLMSALGEGTHSRSDVGGNIVIGIVTNNQDPLDQNRVRVKFPWLSDTDESTWARLVSPMAGKNRGFMFIPEIDDEVLVAFEHGDINYPFVIGAVWNGKDAPPEPSSKGVVGGKVERRTIKSRIGHLMLMEDTDGKGEISLLTKSGHFVQMDDKDEKILIKTKDGHKITLDDRGNKIEVMDKTGQNSMTIDSGPGNISFKCLGQFSVSAVKGVSISTQGTMSATATMTFTISGAMVNIN